MQMSRIYSKSPVCYILCMKKVHDTTYFGELLKKNSLKVTSGRLEILSILANDHTPLTADDIANKIKASTIDRATIYRTLSSYEKANIVKKIHLHTGSEHFELNDNHHHHLVCTGCGSIEDFELCDMEQTKHKILKNSAFQRIDTHSLELFGVCKKCFAK